MSGPVLLLYGSRARGEFRAESDVDLLLALEDGDPGASSTANGVSLHRYPQHWLKASARAGSLFSYHVAFEGVALEDQGDFLGVMRSLYVPKPSYEGDLILGALVMKLLLEKDWGANFAARRRFFWALRTVLIAVSTRVGEPTFASTTLEAKTKISGVADLIDARESAPFDICYRIGSEVLKKFAPSTISGLSGSALRDHLMTLGGIASDSVRVVEEDEAIADMGLAIYL